jgi:hypothetical protein
MNGLGGGVELGGGLRAVQVSGNVGPAVIPLVRRTYLTPLNQDSDTDPDP